MTFGEMRPRARFLDAQAAVREPVAEEPADARSPATGTGHGRRGAGPSRLDRRPGDRHRPVHGDHGSADRHQLLDPDSKAARG